MLGNKYVTAVVGIALALVIAYNVKFFASRTGTVAGTGQQKETAHPAGKAEVTGRDRVPATTAEQGRRGQDKASWKRDPFSLQATPDSFELPENIRLTGIIRRDGRGYALINGRVYGVNDRVGSSVIREIRRHSIVLVTHGRVQELSFDDYNVLKEKKK